MIVLTGLGNPGAKYANHRHNIGFMLLDEIFRQYEFSPWRNGPGRRHQPYPRCAEGRIGVHKITLFKPMTFMNISGLPVQYHMEFYKLDLENLIVAHDDVDLAPGKIRVKTGGGHGGHNGLRDIDQHIGQNYRRIRIGVGRPPHTTSSDKMIDKHVLSDFTKAEIQDWVTPTIDCLTKEIGCLLDDGGDENFMTTVARLCPPPKTEPASR
jgi:PTH1 family peptidyl-tRNA hydrolase